MTDNDIIKALECCGGENYETDCPKCPLHNDGDCNCKLAKHSLELINRKNAEIESLKNHTDFLKSELNKVKEKLYGITGKWDETLGGIDKIANEVRAEAFKECIEKIKSRSTKAVMTDHGIVVAGSATYQISEVKLFEIKNELAGEQNV